MRGQNVFKEIAKGINIEQPLRKGRNNSLVKKRNECLANRYFYYATFKGMCYEETIRQLVGEFFLSPSTIANLVLENSDLLQSLKKKEPSLYYFQTRWPHLKWQ